MGRLDCFCPRVYLPFLRPVPGIPKAQCAFRVRKALAGQNEGANEEQPEDPVVNALCAPNAADGESAAFSFA